MSIKVQNEVTVYEQDGIKAPLLSSKSEFAPVVVVSHWNQRAMVVLKFKIDEVEKTVTVNANDLQAAINNATNCGAF